MLFEHVTMLGANVRKLICDSSSFDIPLHESADVVDCTVVFKQLSMVLELQSLHVKLCSGSKLLLEAFLRQQAYMDATPKSEMICPACIWRGVHEQRSINCCPSEFWNHVSENELIKASVSPPKVVEVAESLVREKISDVISKGNRMSHDTARGLRRGVLIPRPYQRRCQAADRGGEVCG